MDMQVSLVIKKFNAVWEKKKKDQNFPTCIYCRTVFNTLPKS